MHIVTVNDYLAKRDAAWMGTIYHFLGLSVGVIIPKWRKMKNRQPMMLILPMAPIMNLALIICAITWCCTLHERVQRALNFAIVDEVDSILIDEARTPLIISGPAEGY